MFTLLKGWEVLAGSLLREGGDDDEREDVQKKTFAKWINSQLVKNGKPLVSDLFSDLRDGEVLLSLLEILTAQQYKRERGRMRVHHVNNVSTALRALAAAGVRLVNISSSDVVDGNPKLILGLVWSIILHWQVQYHLKDLMTELQQTSLERTLLAWCRAHTQGYAGVDVVNFTWSWADGLALNALLHRWRPALFAWEALAARAPRDRLDHAFALAHDYLGIDRLLDPEDVDTPNPDKKSIMMYLMCLFQSLPHAADASRRRARPRRTAASRTRPTTASLPRRTAGATSRLHVHFDFESLIVPYERVASAVGGDDGLGRAGRVRRRAGGRAGLAAGRRGAPGRARAAAPRRPLPDLKEHFHTHEVTGARGRGAGAGARLAGGGGGGAGAGAGEGALSAAEAREVRLQRRLLAARWETLRRRGMERQAAVHAALMRAQRETRDDFRQWLTATEDRISQLGPLPGDTPERAAASLAAVEQLHQALRHQQPRVDALADCVLVLDDDDDNDHADVVQMEDELRALGERWSHTCQWTLAQLGRLRALRDLQPTDAEERLKQDERRALGERWSHTCQWTLAQLGRLRALRDLQPTDAEERLKQDERRALAERWSHTCQWTLAQLGRLRALRDLQPTDAEERLKQPGVDGGGGAGAHGGAAAAGARAVGAGAARAGARGGAGARAGGAPAGVDLRDVQARAEAVLDQHDALRMILAVQAQRIREQGFEFELDMEPASDAEDAVSGSTTTESTPAPDAGRSKKPRLSPAADFQAGYTPYENWCARSLEEDSSCAEDAADTLGRLEGELAQQRVQFAPVTEIHSRLSAQPGLEGT
ncbi:hypothetical protein MSG28_011628 [Choristoneura fumiferana]|uniref:Uncharacterized protein n=1 Tax=Choristoneura fumiferana TaxID=7141 RepID=A0ACC0KL39_CHOFU|nr:hypothetical protein MSG28_011628 [Choristoneura fumiferana]